MDYCSYYQANVLKKMTWFFVAAIRSYDHVAFDRTLDKEKGIFEFFVPQDMEEDFLSIMAYLEKEGIVSNLQKLENRLRD